MGKIQFNIPDYVVRRFEEVFEGQDKDAVVTELLRRALEERSASVRRGFREQVLENHARCTRSHSES